MVIIVIMVIIITIVVGITAKTLGVAMKKSLSCIAGLLISLPASAGLWVAASGGFVPTHAYQVGVEPDGGPLFLCRGLYDGFLYEGAINSAFEGCDITVAGNIISIPRYSVWVEPGTQPLNGYYGPGAAYYGPPR